MFFYAPLNRKDENGFPLSGERRSPGCDAAGADREVCRPRNPGLGEPPMRRTSHPWTGGPPTAFRRKDVLRGALLLGQTRRSAAHENQDWVSHRCAAHPTRGRVGHRRLFQHFLSQERHSPGRDAAGADREVCRPRSGKDVLRGALLLGQTGRSAAHEHPTRGRVGHRPPFAGKTF